MADRDTVLPIRPDDADDPALAARMAAMYASLPARTLADAERCAEAVLRAARAQGWRPSMPRQRWWWGAAAAAVLVAVTMRPWRPGVSTRDADSAFTSAMQNARTAPQGSI